MANARFYPELKRLQKVANERIRQLEKKAPGAPALAGIQATLEMMGVKKGSATGRRFSETGKADWNTAEKQMKILKKFIGGESTITRYKGRMKSVYEAADREHNLKEHGISQEDYYKMWANAPDKGSRPFGSEVYIEMVERVMDMNKERRAEDRLSIEDIMQTINDSKDVSSAYNSLGISIDWEDTEDDFFN